MTDKARKAKAGVQKSPRVDKAPPAAGKDEAQKPQATAAGPTPDASAETSSGPDDATTTAQQPNGHEDQPESADATDEGGEASDGENKRSAEEFAREHDPAEHDIAAGEESRQPGDWTGDEADGRTWDGQGNLVEGTSIVRADSDPQEVGDVTVGQGPARDGRRTSSLEEVRDGGYSVGSAAPLADGALPLGHPVQAWEATKTFITPDDAGYDEREPDLWFTDADAARRAGFHPAD